MKISLDTLDILATYGDKQAKFILRNSQNLQAHAIDGRLTVIPREQRMHGATTVHLGTPKPTQRFFAPVCK